MIARHRRIDGVIRGASLWAVPLLFGAAACALIAGRHLVAGPAAARSAGSPCFAEARSGQAAPAGVKAALPPGCWCGAEGRTGRRLGFGAVATLVALLGFAGWTGATVWLIGRGLVEVDRGRRPPSGWRASTARFGPWLLLVAGFALFVLGLKHA